VPWLNRPVPLYVAPEPKLVRYPTSARACRGRQLRVSQGRGGVGLGNRLERFVFTNTGTLPCLLRGYPIITGVTSDGIRRAARPERGGTYFGQLVPADMAPGGRTFLDLATSTGCAGGARPGTNYTQVVFGLPAGGSIRAGHVSITDVCGLSMSEFGLTQRHATTPRAAAGTAGTLSLQLELPATVRVGSLLRYTVTLVNSTKTSVTLRPCPSYTQGLYANGAVVHRSLALNCDSVGVIPAHHRVRYAIQLSVPRRATPGTGKVGWGLDTPTGPFAGRVITVTA
jgi:hypothetical protein